MLNSAGNHARFSQLEAHTAIASSRPENERRHRYSRRSTVDNVVACLALLGDDKAASCVTYWDCIIAVNQELAKAQRYSLLRPQELQRGRHHANAAAEFFAPEIHSGGWPLH